MASKPSISEEFELGGVAGREAERALMARRLHRAFEALTAASFAIELAKEPGERQVELVSRASKLLTESIELLREVVNDQKVENLKKTRLSRL